LIPGDIWVPTAQTEWNSGQKKNKTHERGDYWGRKREKERTKPMRTGGGKFSGLFPSAKARERLKEGGEKKGKKKRQL